MPTLSQLTMLCGLLHSLVTRRPACSRSLLFGCLFLAACTTPEKTQPPEELRLGWIGVMAAPAGQRALDQDLLEGARLRVEEAVAAGGLLLDGRRYNPVLIAEDTRLTPLDAVDVARRLISQREVLALIGPNRSRDAIAVGAVAENAGIPMISPGSSHPQTTAGRQWVFRATFTDPDQAKALARFARRELGIDTCAVLYDIADDYARDLTLSFRTEVERLGVSMVAIESYTTEETTWDSQLERIRAARPEALFLPSYTPAARDLLIAARRLGISATVLGTDAWLTDQLEGMPEADGAYLCHHWHPSLIGTDPKALAFQESYRQRWHRPPTSYAALAWDSVGLVLDALERAGRHDPAALRTALAATQGYEGLTGTFTFQGRGGDPDKAIHLLRFTGGRTVVHRTLALPGASSPP